MHTILPGMLVRVRNSYGEWLCTSSGSLTNDDRMEWFDVAFVIASFAHAVRPADQPHLFVVTSSGILGWLYASEVSVVPSLS